MAMEIKSEKVKDRCTVRVPGSKSYTHRLLIAASLASGVSCLENPLNSDDTRQTAEALKQLGALIEGLDGRAIVTGTGGRLAPCSQPIDLGDSGTSVRLVTALAAIGEGWYRITGSARMQERPIGDLLQGLSEIGVSCRSVNGNACPPVEILGNSITGSSVSLNCGKSSQFLSALLLIAPYTRNGLTVSVTEGPVSKPYIDITLEVMARMGIAYSRDGYRLFHVPGQQAYRSGTYAIEPDASQAGYFWAAAAVTGAAIRVKGLFRTSCQGDVKLLDLLSEMGCRVWEDAEGTWAQGHSLKAIDADMADLPDMVPTLAVVAALAEGTTSIRNVGHLRIKESDRLSAVAAELQKMGICAQPEENGLVVQGGKPKAARIRTYRDHRIAMSFAVAGLAAPGTVIEDERCVEKSFPEFWEVFERLYDRPRQGGE